jgi:hypothetical protein
MSSQLQLLSPLTRTQFVANFPAIEESAIKFSGGTDRSVEAAIESIFNYDKTESKIAKARKILGEVAASLTDSELQTYLTEFEFLLDSWIDEFERQVFDNKTLREVLREG